MTTPTYTNAQWIERWQEQWPAALDVWSRFTQLQEPTFFERDDDAKPYGMSGEIAAIRLVDQRIMVNMVQVRRRDLMSDALPILAHEIGHHLFVPGNLADHARMLGAIQSVASGFRQGTAAIIANLYGDLLINDRLQRRHGMDVAGMYRRMNAGKSENDQSAVWQVYMRAYEHLWRLPSATLAFASIKPEMNADAALIARLIRHFAGDWLRGAARFASIMAPYFIQDEKRKGEHVLKSAGLADMQCAGRSADGEDGALIPDGLATFDPAEFGDTRDFDEALAEELGESAETKETAETLRALPFQSKQTANAKGQFREPFAYGELLKALGLKLSQDEITVRYYRELAMPHLIPFPTRPAPRATEPFPEGYESWEAGEDLNALDLFGSLLKSPEIIPGVTTVQRVYGEAPGTDPAKTPMDLDIYVDSSGSMPCPHVNVSYLALAGAILALSALRAGARVQATVWSGVKQFKTTGGFVRDEMAILRIVAGYISGATAFPLHVLRETTAKRKPSDPPAHLVVISDDGVDTILAVDEKGNRGEKILAEALKSYRGGGTFALNVFPNWKLKPDFEKRGVRVHTITDWTQLIAFARAFVRENYV